MNKENEKIFLCDMDGTVVDYDSPLKEMMDAVKHPDEPEYIPGFHDKEVPYIRARRKLITRQPDWFANLPVLKEGMKIVNIALKIGYRIIVLTKGPSSIPEAWMDKVKWVRENMPYADITITEDKGLTYGTVLMDDYPPYVERWLEWRPRGVVIMPEYSYNKNFKHPNVIKNDGSKEAINIIINNSERAYKRL